MADMKNTLSIFWIFDKKIWGDRINTNEYFATISLLIIALSGAINGGATAINNFFDTNLNTNLAASLGFCAFVYGLNLYESIIASENISTAIYRSIYMLFITAGLFVLGYIVSFLVIALVIIIFFGAIVLKMLGTTLTGGPDKASVSDEYGNKVKLKKNMWGDYEGSDGSTWKDNYDGTATRQD